MATESGYTVMPLSALKKLHKELFEALRADKTVYVSKHGRIVAAFRPYGYVPESVVAAYASPNLELPTLSARDIQRTSLSKPVAEAEAGLPAVVEKDSRIYGMLTPASAPPPEAVPDRDVVAAKAAAMLDFQQRNPNASIEDVMAFAGSLDAAPAEQSAATTWPIATDFVAADGVAYDIEGWREKGSDVEDEVEGILAALEQGVRAAARRKNGASLPSVPKLRKPKARKVNGNAVTASSRAVVRTAEQLEAAGEPVDARARYVEALTADPLPNVGVMWRLGNLARSTGHLSEAARWFQYSLAYDALAGGAQH